MGRKEYSNIPHADEFGEEERKKYIRDFGTAYRVLSHSSIPQEIRDQAVELAYNYSFSKIEESRSREKYVRKLAARILQTGRTIIDERGWSPVPSGNNFSAQLLKAHRITDSLLDALHSGKLMQRGGGIVGYVFQTENVPDFFPNDKHTQDEEIEAMRNLFHDIANRLGFFSGTGDNFMTKMQYLSRERDSFTVDIRHPSEPLVLSFSSDTKPTGTSLNGFSSANRISMSYYYRDPGDQRTVKQ